MILCSLVSALSSALSRSDSTVAQLLGDFIVFLVSLFSQYSGILKLVLKGFHSLFVLQALVLQDLAHTLGVITSGGSLVQLLGGIQELLLGDIEVGLQLLHLLLEIADFLLGLLSTDIGILCLLFTGIGPVHGIVLLKLHSLHFLFDGLHVGWM